MCGRYLFTVEQSAEIRRIAQEIQRQYGDRAWTPGEIRPTATAPVLLAGRSGVLPELHHWGYRLPDSLVINARAETVEEKPLFRDSVTNGRCVVPTTGFYKWDSGKRKYLFTLPGSDALYIAGLWSVRDGLPCFCVLTTGADASMREVHPRMPLVLDRTQVRPWLEELSAARMMLHQTPPLLEKVSADAQLRLW